MVATCYACKTKFSKTKTPISCDECDKQYHAACLDVCEGLQQLLHTGAVPTWSRVPCKEELRNVRSENSRLRQENTKLLHDMASLVERLNTIENQFSTMKTDVKSEIIRELPNYNQYAADYNLRDEITACLREDKEREKRKELPGTTWFINTYRGAYSSYKVPG